MIYKCCKFTDLNNTNYKTASNWECGYDNEKGVP